MDARKIQTKIWTDSWFMDLSRAGKVLFLYTLTNKNVNLTGIYECNDRVICFETGLAISELETAKEELKGKVDFHNDWVRVRNQLKYDPIKGEKNNLWIAYEKQLEAIPEVIKKYFDDIDEGIEAPLKGVITPLEGTKGIGKGKGKGKGIGNKGGVGGNDFASLDSIDNENLTGEIAQHFKTSEKTVRKCREALRLYCQSKGKAYRNYKAAWMNFVRMELERHPDMVIKPTVNTWKPEYQGMATNAVPLEEIQRRINAPCPSK